MSQENVEVVRSICAAWERADFSSAEWADREIEYMIVDGPTPGSWIGRAGMVEGWGSFLDAWNDFRAEAEGFRELEGGRVLALVQFSGHGKASGLDVGQMQSRGANLFHLRDGKVTRLVTYMDRERALEAVGLRE